MMTDIHLRKIREDDAGHFERWLADPYVAESMWLLRDPEARLPEVTADFAVKMTWNLIEKNLTFIVETVENRPIGYVGFKPCENPAQWEIFFAIGDPDARGRDLATSAIHRAIRRLCQDKQVEEIRAEVFDFSSASIRTLEKADFTYAGMTQDKTWRDGQPHDILLYTLHLVSQAAQFLDLNSNEGGSND